MKMLLMSLLRGGDLLMMGSAYKLCFEADPQVDLNVVINDEAKPFRQLLDPRIKVQVFPRKAIQLSMNEPAAPSVLPLVKSHEALQTLRQAPYDQVVNLSHTRVGALLAHGLETADTSGLIFDGTEYSVKGSVFQFMNKEIHWDDESFHMQDLWAWSLGFERPAANWAQKTALSKVPTPYLVIQASASEEKKMWRDELWMAALLGFKVMAPGTPIKWLCAPNELERWTPLVEKLKAKSIQVELIACDLIRAAEIVDGAACVVTVDTYMAHLAASLSRPTIVLALGSGNSYSHGPYLDGAFVVQGQTNCYPCEPGAACTQPSVTCQSQVAPHVIAFLAARLVRREPVESDRFALSTPTGTKIFRTSTSDLGFHTLIPFDLSQVELFGARWLRKIAHYNAIMTDQFGADQTATLAFRLVRMMASEKFGLTHSDLRFLFDPMAEEAERIEEAIKTILESSKRWAKNSFSSSDRIEFLSEVQRLARELGTRALSEHYAHRLRGLGEWRFENGFTVYRLLHRELIAMQNEIMRIRGLLNAIERQLESRDESFA